jgi:hypothetical protein
MGVLVAWLLLAEDRSDRWGHEERYLDADEPLPLLTPLRVLRHLGIEGEPPAVQRLRLAEFFAQPHPEIPEVVRQMLAGDGLL